MRLEALKSEVALGEDSTRQFKADVCNAESLASEMAAFANTRGGTVFIGVTDDHDGCLFTAMVHRRPGRDLDPTLSPPNGSGKSSGKSSGNILEMLKQSGNMTIPELAERIGITSRAVEKQISALKKSGALRRVGSAKGGHWEVLDQ